MTSVSRLSDPAAGASLTGGAGLSAAVPGAPAPSGTGVRLEGIGMTYIGTQGPTQAIGDVTGTVTDGRFVSVIGPSGCGKTTLLDIVGGLLKPTTGKVTIDGEAVKGPRRDMAMVFQEDSTLHWRTVLENVAFGLEVAGVGKRERRTRCQDMIDLVGLTGFERHRPRQLSGGMKQRVALARALVLEPRILLMDEPFGALDQQTRTFIGAELLRIWEQTRKSVLFITHDIREAVYLSDEVWVLSKRPSVVKEVIQIELPRPRTDETMNEPLFHDYVARLWSHIKEEAGADDHGRGTGSS